MAALIPFPLARRRKSVIRHAAHMAALSATAADGYLERQMAVQRETLTRKGVVTEVVDREVDAMERAIRSELSLFSSRSGGAA